MQLVIRIATLNGVFTEKEVAMAVLPAFDGEVGIMESHIPSVFKLNDGLVKLYDTPSHINERIFLCSGFAKISENKIDIVTDKAMRLEDIDLTHTTEHIKSLENQLMSSGDKLFLQYVKKELTLYRKMLEAISTKH
jgi:F-type H+-transporting ATPase subunit epsilon